MMPGYVVTGPNGKEYDVDAPEGASQEEIISRAQQYHFANVNTAADIAKSAGAGLAKGVIGIPGLPGDVAGMVPWAADKLRSGLVWSGLASPEWAAADQAREAAKGMRDNPLPTSADIQRRVEQTTGPFYQPQTVPGQYAQTVGQFMPMAMTGPGGIARRVATGVTSGLGSETAGQLTEGTQAEPYARVLGAVLADPRVAMRAVTPFPSTPARQTAVDTLRGAGVTDLSAGQITGSFPLRKMESTSAEVPFGSPKAAAMEESSKGQFTRAALQTMGEDAERASPEVLQRARDRLGQAFKDLSARNQVMYDQQLYDDLQTVHNEYGRVLPSQQRDAIGNYFQDIADQGTSMPGTVYQDTRSRLSRQANAVKNSDPSFSMALAGTRNALDDAMSRSVHPQDQAAWQEARRQWGNMRRVENAVASSGELITPNSLATAAKTGRRSQYVRAQGDLDELAQAGKAVMSPLPNSGTPAGIQALMALSGGLAGHAAIGGAEGVGAGLAAPAISSRVLMSRPVQGYLSNQVLADALRNWGEESIGRKAARAAVQTEAPRRLSVTVHPDSPQY